MLEKILGDLRTIEGNNVTEQTVTLGTLGRGLYSEYGIKTPNALDHIGNVGRHQIYVGDVVQITRQEELIAKGFPRFIEGEHMLLTDDLKSLEGDDVDDSPADDRPMSIIKDGVKISLKKGDVITLYANSITRQIYKEREKHAFRWEGVLMDFLLENMPQYYFS